MSLPGDFVRYGELAEEALQKSVFQQTTFSVEPIEILGIYSNIDNRGGLHIIESVFVCIITNIPEMGMKTGSGSIMCGWTGSKLKKVKIVFTILKLLKTIIRGGSKNLHFGLPKSNTWKIIKQILSL